MFKTNKSAKRRIIYFVFGGFFLVLIGCYLFSDPVKDYQAKNKYIDSNTPTIFLHGWGGSIDSEKPLVEAAEKVGATNRKLIIHVNNKGSIKLSGNLPRYSKSPVIMVNFDNKRAGEFKYSEWLLKITKLLKSKYGVKRINLVGHSMGSYAAVNYLITDGYKDNVPTVNKMVVIAGPYDGIIDNHNPNQPLHGNLSKLWDDYPYRNQLDKDGRPKIIHPEYQQLLDKQANLPKQVKILNIYGELDNDSKSDGVVTEASALSLGYLVKGRIQSYETLKVSGPDAQHSALHQGNHKVDNALIDFLWKK